jgi:hypothetical protein
MSMMKNALRRWLDSATSTEKQQLANKARTSLGNLAQIAGGYKRNGKASTSPDTARKIEQAAASLQREGLPAVLREDLCVHCNKCELAKAARLLPLE